MGSYLGSIAILLREVKLVSKCGYQSVTRCSNSLHMYLGSSGVHTLENICENMLTHVHKVIHLVVGTFEQGLETSPAPYTEKTGVHRVTGRWWCCDRMLGLESDQ